MNNHYDAAHGVTLKEVYDEQVKNQMLLIKKGIYGDESKELILPADNVKIANNQLLHLVSEIGEVLEADKRWKSFRNNKYDSAAKAEELADCFIILLNVVMFSGISCDELVKNIQNKINVVRERADNVG